MNGLIEPKYEMIGLKTTISDSLNSQLINKEFDERMLEILVCPLSKDKLFYNKKTNSLDSMKVGLSYPIKDNVPILIIVEAIKI